MVHQKVISSTRTSNVWEVMYSASTAPALRLGGGCVDAVRLKTRAVLSKMRKDIEGTALESQPVQGSLMAIFSQACMKQKTGETYNCACELGFEESQFVFYRNILLLLWFVGQSVGWGYDICSLHGPSKRNQVYLLI